MNTFFYGPSAVPVAILSPLVPNIDTVAEGTGASRIENPALLHLFTNDLILLLGCFALKHVMFVAHGSLFLFLDDGPPRSTEASSLIYVHRSACRECRYMAGGSFVKLLDPAPPILPDPYPLPATRRHSQGPDLVAHFVIDLV